MCALSCAKTVRDRETIFAVMLIVQVFQKGVQVYFKKKTSNVGDIEPKIILVYSLVTVVTLVKILKELVKII